LSILAPLSTQSSPDISHCNAITCATMQNPDNQIWKSRISTICKHSTHFPVRLWAVTKRDALKIDALNQWCLWKLSGIKCITKCGMMMWDSQPSYHTFQLLSRHGVSACSAILHECQMKQMPRS